MARYIETLLAEKSISLETSLLENESNIGLTIEILIDFIYSMPARVVIQVENTFRKIDFANGSIMNYVEFLAQGMIITLKNIANQQGKSMHNMQDYE